MRRRILTTLILICVICFSFALFGCTSKSAEAQEPQKVRIVYRAYKEEKATGKRTRDDKAVRYAYIYMEAPGKGVTEGRDVVYPKGEFKFWTEEYWNWRICNYVDRAAITEVKLYKSGKQIHKYTGSLPSANKKIIILSKELETGEYTLEVVVEVVSQYSFNYEYRGVIQYDLTVDGDCPNLKIASGQQRVKSGDYVHQGIEIKAIDERINNIYVEHKGEVVHKSKSSKCNYEFTSPGKYEVYADDTVGNRSEVKTIYYDDTDPTLAVLENGVETNKEYAKGSISFVAEDANGIKRIVYWTDRDKTQREYKGVPLVTNKGKETLYVFAEDISGRKTKTRKIIVDSQAPEVKIFADGVLLKEETTNAKAIAISVMDDDEIEKVEVTRNGNPYEGDISRITENGIYEIVAYDKAGNASKKGKVIFDNVKPKLKVISDKQPALGKLHTNKKVLLDVSDEYDLKAKIYVKKDSSAYKELYQREIVEDGEYEIYAKDECGNRSEKLFIKINRTIPTCKLLIDEEEYEGLYTNARNIKIESSIGGKVFHKHNGEWVEYSKAYELQDGEHFFKTIDKEDNESAVRKIIVDRVVPEITTSDIVNTPFNIVFKNDKTGKEIKEIYVNDKPYNGEKIYPIYGGEYTVQATDKAGNKCTKTIRSEYEGYIHLSPIDETYDTPNLKGEMVSYSTYEKAKEFATQREMSLVKEKPFSEELLTQYLVLDGEKTPKYGEIVYIYKTSKNGIDETIYFSKTALFATLFQNIEKSIRKTMYFEKDSYIYGDENVHLKDKVIQKENFAVGAEYILSLDGEECNQIDREGENIVEICDKFGQKKEYKIRILKRVPELKIKNEYEGVELTKKAYFSKGVEFIVEKESHILIYNEAREMIACYSSCDVPHLHLDGRYYVQTVNRYGKGKMIEIVISREKPVVEFFLNEKTQKLDINIISGESILITDVQIWLTKDGKSQQLFSDCNGALISETLRTYVFNKSGVYVVKVKDAAHIDNHESRFTFVKPQPRYRASSDKSRVTRGFSVEYEGDVVASIVSGARRQPYASGVVVTKEGKHVIYLSNEDGFYKEISFEIDNTPPQIVGSFERKGNKDVSLNFIDATDIYINKERIRHTKINCTKSGKYEIVALDDVGNKSEVSFEIDKEVRLDGVVDNGLYNAVNIVPLEELNITISKDKKQISFVQTIKDSGEYELFAKDKLGNEKKIKFRVIPEQMKALSHNFGNNEFTVNGTKSSKILTLTENGKYEIQFAGHKTLVEIVNRVPQLKIDGLIKGGSKANKATIKAEKGSNVEILYKGKKIPYYEGMVCDKLGKYEVSVTDSIGNQNKMHFEIVKKKPIALIVILSLSAVVAVVVVGIMFAKKKKKNKKEKKK